MYIEKILNLQETKAIKDKAKYWIDFLYKQVNFHMEDSLCHSVDHCGRVILFALTIGKEMCLSDRDLDILGAAGAFHDSRRHDDFYDTGHGVRAAVYYKDFCQKGSLDFGPITYDIMRYHDRNDELGIKNISKNHGQKGVLLYKIFKDADALDRHRLAQGQGGLDPSYLRTQAGKDLCDFSKRVWQMYLQSE